MLAAALGTGLTVLGAWLAIDAGEPGKTPRIESRRAPAASNSSRDRTLETLLECAGSAEDPDRRDELLEQAVALMVEKDPAAALAFLGRSSSPELREEFQARLLHDWAERAPEQARAAVLEMEGDPSPRLLAIVHETWADHDLAAAVASLDSLPAGDAAEQAAISIAGEAIRTDPGQALKLLAPLPPSPERDSLLIRAATEWTGPSEADAIAWARRIDEPALRMSVFAGIATALGETRPEAAAGLALETIGPGKLLDDTVVAIIQRWAQSDPQAAAMWIEGFPTGSLRNVAADNLAGIRSVHYPESATVWSAWKKATVATGPGLPDGGPSSSLPVEP